MRTPKSAAAAAPEAAAAPRVKLRWKALLRRAFGEDKSAEVKLKALRRRACDAARQVYADAGAEPPDRRVRAWRRDTPAALCAPCRREPLR
jgi:hypothetical protein